MQVAFRVEFVLMHSQPLAHTHMNSLEKWDTNDQFALCLQILEQWHYANHHKPLSILKVNRHLVQHRVQLLTVCNLCHRYDEPWTWTTLLSQIFPSFIFSSVFSFSLYCFRLVDFNTQVRDVLFFSCFFTPSAQQLQVVVEVSWVKACAGSLLVSQLPHTVKTCMQGKWQL